jgi:hypothetical protein
MLEKWTHRSALNIIYDKQKKILYEVSLLQRWLLHATGQWCSNSSRRGTTYAFLIDSLVAKL